MLTGNISSLEHLLKTDTIPISCLGSTTRKLLSNALNQRKILPSEENYLRDWQGLEELMQLSTEFKIAHSSTNPTADLLEAWVSQDKGGATLNKFYNFLIKMDRWDIIDDCGNSILNDANKYRNEPKTVSLAKPIEFDYGDDIADTYYDACVLYAEEDENFVIEMIEIMENKYNRKLFVEQRAVRAGAIFKHDLLSRVIEERCKHIIVILTPDFYRSQTNQFLANIAQANGIEKGVRKLIPCLYKPCNIPVCLKYHFHLKYKDSSRLCNFWDKLNESIEAKNDTKMNFEQKVITPKPIPCAISYNKESFETTNTRNNIHIEKTTNALQVPSHTETMSSAISLSNLAQPIEPTDNSLEKKELFNSTSLLVVNKKKGFMKKMLPWLRPKSDIEKKNKKKKKSKEEPLPA